MKRLLAAEIIKTPDRQVPSVRQAQERTGIAAADAFKRADRGTADASAIQRHESESLNRRCRGATARECFLL